MKQQNTITKLFIQQVDSLIEKGILASDAELVTDLRWNKSSMSQVRNMKQNVPVEVYRKFVSHYKLKKEIPEAEEDFREKYLQSLEEQNRFYKERINSLTTEMAEVTAMTRAIVETNQDSIAQIMVKLKIASIGEVNGQHRKANLMSYSKTKSDLGIG